MSEANCRGCYVLGTACQKCEKCKAYLADLITCKKDKEKLEARNKELKSKLRWSEIEVSKLKRKLAVMKHEDKIWGGLRDEVGNKQ